MKANSRLGGAVGGAATLLLSLVVPAEAGPVRELSDPYTPPGDVRVCSGIGGCTLPSVSSSGGSVTIHLKDFGTGATVHLWWMHGEPPSESTRDCSRDIAGTAGRSALPDVLLDSTPGTITTPPRINLAEPGSPLFLATLGGAGSVTTSLPPTVAGVGWVCGTTASAGNASGVIDEAAIAVTPV